MSDAVAEKAMVGDILGTTDWSAALEEVDLVVHAAARAHVLHDSESSSNLYLTTNAQGTRHLAHAAASAGVRRFVYLSSIKVNGEETTGAAYTSSDEPRPQDAYGKSKWLGEQWLGEIAGKSGMEAVIIRSPLVYGPGVRANFLRLMRWVDRGWPLPVGAIRNQRSLVSIWNLCDLLRTVLTHPLAAGRTWLVSDGEDLSTPELIRRLGRAMNRRVRLLPVPSAVLEMCGVITGRRAEIARLCGSLVLDVSQTRSVLDWCPPLSVDEALARTVAWYLSDERLSGA
jgi:nucleoside-diphosphate-sugar epimerase